MRAILSIIAMCVVAALIWGPLAKAEAALDAVATALITVS